MPVLDVAAFEQNGTPLLVVFVPAETTFFNDEQRARLRDLLVNRLAREGLSGVLLVVWEYEGDLHYMTTAPWDQYLEQTTYAELYAKRNRQITVD